MKHKFDEYGSLSSECKRCGMPFSFAHNDWTGWVGRPCRATPYTGDEMNAINDAHRNHHATFRDTQGATR